MDTVDHPFIDHGSISNTIRKLEELCCTCPIFVSEEYPSCPIHRPQRPDSVIGELLWKYDCKSCEKCNSNNNNSSSNNLTKWNNINNWSATIVRCDWESENLRNNLRNIWNGGEVRTFTLIMYIKFGILHSEILLSRHFLFIHLR